MKAGRFYLLDTNTVAYVIGGRSKAARRRLASLSGDDRVAISAVTEAEVRYGVARKPNAVRLSEAVEEFLAAMEILPWDSDAARAYGAMRAAMSAKGHTLSAMDMLVAAHAASVGATLVTSDKAFRHARGLVEIVDWAPDL